MFEKKDEVIIKHKSLKNYKKIKNLKVKEGRKFVSRVGRVVSLNDDFLEVDFYYTSPSKFTVKKEDAKIVTKASERDDVAGEPLGNLNELVDKDYLNARELGESSKKELSLREQAKNSLDSLFESAPLELKTNAKKEIEEDCKVIKKAREVVEDKKFGKAQVSATGSLRYNEGKPPIHQVPYCAIKGMAEVLAYGEHKYGKWNWQKGNQFSVPYDSAQRHLNSFFWECDNDPETKMNHLKHALTNIAMLLYYYENYPEMDDRPIKESNGS